MRSSAPSTCSPTAARSNRSPRIVCPAALPTRSRFPAMPSRDASKLYVKIYPGAMAQVIEGLDGMLRMPGGCFEQTSSSAFPNILIVDYIKKTRTASPAILMKAEAVAQRGLSTPAHLRAARRRLRLVGPRGAARLAERVRPARVQRHGARLSDRPRHHRPHAGVPDEQARRRRHLVEDRRDARRIDRAHGRSETAADQLCDVVAAGERLQGREAQEVDRIYPQ